MENELLLYKEEVKELTALLKNEWLDLKDLLSLKGIDVDSCYLLGYFETDNGEEIGLLYTKDELKKFEVNKKGINIENVTKEQIKNDFPQIVVLNDLSNYSNW